MRAYAMIALLIATGVLVGCGESKRLPFDPGEVTPDPSATFTRVQVEVLSPSCALPGCHAGSAPQQGLDLSAAAAYSNLVGVPATERSDLLRVAPGDPENSYVVKKLRGDADIVGSPMPLGGSVSQEAKQLVIDWVRRGAPRD